ncbi:MAG: hypothetical protein J6X34_03370 [Clostridia bacterium]|nr:hypothetical protein [Clostridia bacterium]
MNITKEQKKQEALERMKLLSLYPNIIREFEKDGIVNMSENGGYLYWLDDEQREYVSDFEEEYNALVYHVIHNYTEVGEMLTFLYVSDDEDEWGYDRDDLKAGYACAYVKNLDEDAFSEFGSVGIKPELGGLIRTE